MDFLKAGSKRTKPKQDSDSDEFNEMDDNEDFFDNPNSKRVEKKQKTVRDSTF